jgi:hypothetical protein
MAAMAATPGADGAGGLGADPDLGAALLDAVRGLDLGRVADGWRGGAPVQAFPSLDLALVVFGRGGTARAANVLFSRELPAGLAPRIAQGRVQGVRFDRDVQDAHGDSIAWLPGADWSRIAFTPLGGAGPQRFVAPYPASLLKLMVAAGVALAVDAGRCAWPADVVEPMLVTSSNEATDELVALLHRVDGITLLHETFARFGLGTLRLDDTKPSGGWRNADGAGVGHIHMTAWDTVRLLWLLDAEAPHWPWGLRRERRGLLRPATRDALRGVLERQQLNEILSSHSHEDLPGHVSGIPRSARFAHKTGTTDNYASDAGIVRDGGLHYLVALLSNLGRRYAPHERAATTWKLPALGAAVHRIASGTAGQ